MAYKALGWAVWKGVKLYLRRRFDKRKVLLGGAAVAAGGAAAYGGARAVRS